MIALEEKGLHNYKSILLSMSQNEHKTADMMKLNPRGQVGVELVLSVSLSLSHSLSRLCPMHISSFFPILCPSLYLSPITSPPYSVRLSLF